MIDYINKYWFDILVIFVAVLFIILVISVISLPLIFIASKGELLYSGYYSKRAMIFSLANAAMVTFILVIASVVFGMGIADENAGSGMMMLIGYSLGFGMIYGSIFSYSAIYLFNKFINKG
jgi:heme/copper-type cytochrome/quinol oxidase subunit 3